MNTDQHEVQINEDKRAFNGNWKAVWFAAGVTGAFVFCALAKAVGLL